MSPTQRDYRILTSEEKAEWERIQNSEVISVSDTCVLRKSSFSKYPKAVRHNLQLFPNHYLDIVELINDKFLYEKAKEFSSFLNNKSVNERAILNFINHKSYYFIIGSLLKKHFNFGHHEAHVFREFPLGTSFKVDYLILGKNSDGWHLVFVELEAPYGNITLGNGDLGSVFRKGKSQIEDWDLWLEKNFYSLQEYFSRHKKENTPLPEELCYFDKSRVSYVVVAGRRDDFKEKTYRIQRTNFKSNVYLIHYDNLVDAITQLTEGNTF